MGIEDDIELARKMAAPRIEKAVRLRDSARSLLGGEQTGIVDVTDDDGVDYTVNFGKIAVLKAHEVTPEVIVYERGSMATTAVAFFKCGAEARVPLPCKMDIVKLSLDGSFAYGRDRRNGRIFECEAFKGGGLTPANDQCCSLCGATVASGRKLLRCARCVDEGLEPHRYCSKLCQRKAWPSHKTWHESVEKGKSGYDLEGAGDKGWAQVRSLSASKRAKMAAANGVSIEYLELGGRASELSAGGNYAKAAKLYKKMIALEPEQSAAHFKLGQVHLKSGHSELAIACFDKAMELERVGSFEWTDGFLAAIVLIMSCSADADTLPSWWSGGRLKVMSKLAIGGAREDPTLIGTAWRIRGHVLSGFAAQRGATDGNIVAETGHKLWLNGHRTPAELEEAAAAYEKARRACQIARQTLFNELERAETCRRWAASVRGTDPERRARFKGLTTEQAFDIAKQVLERRVMNGKTAGANRISSSS